MAQGTYRGTYETADPRAAVQARAMGATIGTDGWWYKDGRKLGHNEADALANSTGKAVDNAHQQWGTGGFIDRNRDSVGNFLQNVAPIAGVLTGGLGGIALGGLGAALGAGARRGTNIGNIVRTGVDNAMLTSSGQNLAAQFGYNGPMSQVGQAAKAAQAAKVAQTAKTTAAQVTQGAGYVDPVTGQILGDVGDLGVELNRGASTGTTFSGPPRASVPRGTAVNIEGVARSGIANLAPLAAPATPAGIINYPASLLNYLKLNTPGDSMIANAGKQVFGFLKDSPTATKGAFDYLSGASKQQSDINDAKLEEIMLGNEAVALEKRRKKQYGEMLAQLFASGFFGNPSGTSTPR